jgi:hypothetical protein
LILHFAKALLTLTQLERLDLMDTHFGESGGRVLAKAIAQQVAAHTAPLPFPTAHPQPCYLTPYISLR